MPGAQPRTRVPVDLPPELYDWLTEQAQRLGMSRNALIVMVLRDEQDKFEQESLAESR